MYYIKKRLEIAGSHSLQLSYPSKCSSIHGHNWIFTIHCRSRQLNADGMVCDFTSIKQQISELLDHQNFNEILPFNPTAENIARWACELIPNCYRVDIQESEGNVASYEID